MKHWCEDPRCYRGQAYDQRHGLWVPCMTCGGTGFAPLCDYPPPLPAHNEACCKPAEPPAARS